MKLNGYVYIFWCEQKKECFPTGRQNTLLAQGFKGHRNKNVLGKVNVVLPVFCVKEEMSTFYKQDLSLLLTDAGGGGGGEMY